jgi:hypothetical protein
MDDLSPVSPTAVQVLEPTVHHSAPRGARLLLLTLLLTLAGPVAAVSAADTAISDAGITPQVWSGGGLGGNVTCAELAPPDDLISSPRMDWSGGKLVGGVPDGIEVSVVDSTRVSWTSEWPITAVIIKGGPAAHVYRYVPALRADAGLVAPMNASGNPAELSNLTFCWLDEDDDGVVDLLALCESTAAATGLGAIVSSSGVMRIRDGAVDPASVPAGHALDVDMMTERIDFLAPYQVVAVVTMVTDPIVHLIAPPSTSGSVAFTTNSGSGDIVLCGLAGGIVTQATCALMAGSTLFGPVRIRDWTIDPLHNHDELFLVMTTDGELDFVSDQQVAGVIVEASDPVVHAFEPSVLSGTIPLGLDSETGDGDVSFCRFIAATDLGGGDDPVLQAAAETVQQQAPRPTEIASGEGPPSRPSFTLGALTLMAFVLTRWRSAWHG